MSSIYSELVRHFNLRQSFSLSQLAKSLAESDGDWTGHLSIVRCRLWPTYRLVPTAPRLRVMASRAERRVLISDTISFSRKICAGFLSREQVANAIVERVRCCARPNFTPLDCPRTETKSDYKYWERIASRFVYFQPDNPDGWIVLGHSHFHLLDREGACKAYRVAARLKDDAATWFSLGLCSQADERIESYRKALRHNVKDWMSWHYLGESLHEAGQYEEAIRCLDTAIEHSGQDEAAWVLCDLGLCYISTHQGEESIRAFERSVRADKGWAFDTMAGQIAEACLPEQPEFTHALHRRVRMLARVPADHFLRCFNTQAARRGYIPVAECSSDEPTPFPTPF